MLHTHTHTPEHIESMYLFVCFYVYFSYMHASLLKLNALCMKGKKIIVAVTVVVVVFIIIIIFCYDNYILNPRPDQARPTEPNRTEIQTDSMKTTTRLTTVFYVWASNQLNVVYNVWLWVSKWLRVNTWVRPNDRLNVVLVFNTLLTHRIQLGRQAGKSKSF